MGQCLGIGISEFGLEISRWEGAARIAQAWHNGILEGVNLSIEGLRKRLNAEAAQTHAEREAEAKNAEIARRAKADKS